MSFSQGNTNKKQGGQGADNDHKNGQGPGNIVEDVHT